MNLRVSRSMPLLTVLVSVGAGFHYERLVITHIFEGLA
jgi:hypothetical protein